MTKSAQGKSLASRLSAARQKLEAAGQGHVLRDWDRLDQAARVRLLDQIDSVDWPEIARLVTTHVHGRPRFAMPENVQPAPWYPYNPGAGADQKAKYARARALGIELVKQNKVAAFTVAGGQGTRLGWEGPKGTFPATPIRGLSLFGCLGEYIANVEQRWNAVVPWYIMTSPVNDGPTRSFFQAQKYFGLDPANVMFFPQAMMPALDMHSGQVLLEAPGSMALSPNGHGGSLKALHSSGAIADMQRRGIEQISYTQIDNPIVRVIDPVFLGLHALDECQMSSKMLPKREPLEKLGNFCLIDGRMTVIEYSDLPDELARARLPDGCLRFLAGSIAIHLLRVDFVARLNAGRDFSLAFHRAEKKVPFVDGASGQVVKPDQPNAVKLETFVFDALPLCERSIIYETDRSDEFAPIKNAPGPGIPDSPQTSKVIQIERAARWLAAAGVKVPRQKGGSADATIEIAQLTAIYPEDLARAKLPASIAAGSRALI